MAIDKTELAALIAGVVEQVLAKQSTGSSVAQKGKSAKIPTNSDQRIEQRYISLLNSFAKKGFKDVQLRDPNDPSKPYNVRPYKGWIEYRDEKSPNGRVVRKGEHGIKGLFHLFQTDAITKDNPVKAPKKVKPAKAAVKA